MNQKMEPGEIKDLPLSEDTSDDAQRLLEQERQEYEADI